MSGRELIALGTSSQAPTRQRSHNAYLLRWDGEGFLLDPGEGTQRQLTLAGVAASSIHRICITHFHGDHCLGLPGVVQRLSLERCDHPVHLYYPESGQVYIDRLTSASIYRQEIELILHPTPQPSRGARELDRGNGRVLKACALDHSVPTIGFRIEDEADVRFDPAKLELAGVRGPRIRELKRAGRLEIEGRTVRLEEVTNARPVSAFAFVMDTRPCEGAVELGRDADLMLMEATYLAEHQRLAESYLHSTAADAAQTAVRAGCRRLALAHFSQRYESASQHVFEAGAIFPEVVALNDFDRIAIPRR